jgi:type VI secretion system protein VasD
MRTWRAMPIGFLLVTGVCLISCSGPPKVIPVKVSLTFMASQDVNPNAENRPSPVVVRMYQLKDDAAFKGADYFALFDKEQATLGAALVSREEYELLPGEHRTLDLQLSPDAHFLGVVAAYRDIRNAAWRAQIGAQDKTLETIVKKNQVNVAVERARIGFGPG